MFIIKNHAILIGNVLAVFLISGASAQNLLSRPESVVYDSARDRYLVSNYSSGHIVSLDPQGNQEYFVQNQYCRNGLHIAGNFVWAACIEQGIKAFDLDSGQLVEHIFIDGAINCNDITSDTSGNLYISDVYANKIYKVNLDDYSYSTFVQNGISQPNGIYFQKRYNRILLVSLINNSPIQSISVADSTVSTIVYTGRHDLDGITEDNEGNIYFSSWGTRSVYFYDSLFTNPPQFLYYNANAPTDIFYDKVNILLAIPVMYSNMVVFLSTPTAVGGYGSEIQPNGIELKSTFPNPFNSAVTFEYLVKSPSNLSIEIFDLLGRKIAVIQDSYLFPGIYHSRWNATKEPSGVYFYKFRSNNAVIANKLTLSK